MHGTLPFPHQGGGAPARLRATYEHTNDHTNNTNDTNNTNNTKTINSRKRHLE